LNSNSNTLTEIVEILSETFGIKDKCNDENCKMDKKNVKKIFSPEIYLREDVLDFLKKKQLKRGNENPNLCDCIVVCCNGKIFIVEILCGSLTSKEFSSKKEQIKACITAIKYIDLKVERCYIVYLSLNMKEHDKRRFQRKATSLRVEGIPVLPERLDKLKDPDKKNTNAFLICK